MKEFIAKNVADLETISQQLLVEFGTEKIVLFKGEMGAGKTTLIKYLCKQLGIDDVTSSPTFSIVNEYVSNKEQKVYHFDFYRINDEQEVMDMGYEDYFYGGAYCFIEWPEKIPNLIPEKFVVVTIEVDEYNNRIISIAS
ncbi:MAG: tRNA (adenosine(37)-N6)-threonylcarbamoyltransferase complex ATPase subunit type 1 TsaE [Flavobacteriales bacterium]|nr:tRNA (adenosine(37)-N6)-threonylcarbamoyltransferase complex ATPase subunit type 1 TsaE [Flavobacteriales bacterium]MCB9335166.1 tRNA (adenosine(37)-N6)-threonylcarbamoyltransferase complex ATPase subunit type 1 TsaE [Flavobacteriales bacterium]